MHKGVLSTDFSKKSKTITDVYYAHLLYQLDEKTRKRKVKKNHLLSGQCISPSRFFGNGEIKTMLYELLEHPHYSSDLAPSDFH